jgi:uncharacterized membrane protein YcaP (DUF421 family)
VQNLFIVDWKGIFSLDVPVAEIFVRGSLLYLILFLLLRFVLKREAGKLGLADVLLIVLVADASQNGMTGDYRSLTDGIVLVTTLVFWNYALDWLGYRFPFIGRLVHPPPLLLVKNGRLLRRNMRQELITEEELRGLLREQGVSELAEVAEARMEGDGAISVIQRQAGDARSAAQPGAASDSGST